MNVFAFSCVTLNFRCAPANASQLRSFIALCFLGWMLSISPPGLTDTKPDPAVDYTPNMIPTTPFGPPAADVLIHPASNFLACSGANISLCYYSGPPPMTEDADLSCKITKSKDGQEFSNCRCIEIEHGPYFVDIHAILDEDIYLATVKECGTGGQNCSGEINRAPVCKAINAGKFLPQAKPKPTTISTFSYQLNSAPGYEIGSTNCKEALYSGCMTAPCVPTGETINICQPVPGANTGEICNDYPITECTCPNFKGPYQVGQTAQEDICNIESGFTWSAAYTPAQELISRAKAKIQAGACVPDAPGDVGCPLISPATLGPPPTPHIPDRPKDINCNQVCKEYRDSAIDGVEVGFTCDATACTTPVGTPRGDLTGDLLVGDACAGLHTGRKGSLSQILQLEIEVGCSCCASQICSCQPSPATNEKISELNDAQRFLGIQPQCDYNGTLCGIP